jgi:hypothetical protein
VEITNNQIELPIVMPYLNEVKTIAAGIQEVQGWLAAEFTCERSLA